MNEEYDRSINIQPISEVGLFLWLSGEDMNRESGRAIEAAT